MKFLLGLLIGIILLPLCAFLYVMFGYAPVATAASPLPLEKKLTHMALDARIKHEAPANSPIDASEQNLVEGAKTYREYCGVCHGMRNQPETAIAKGMYPPVPQLMKGKGVTDDPVGETYWKVANGIRLTGMPAFGKSLDINAMWQVSEFLAHSNQLPAAAETIAASEPPVK